MLEIFWLFQIEFSMLRKNVPYVKPHLHNQKYTYPRLKHYGNNDEINLKNNEIIIDLLTL